MLGMNLTLETLHLNDNDISDNGLKILTDGIRVSKTLKTVIVSEDNCSPNTYKEFMKELSDIGIASQQ